MYYSKIFVWMIASCLFVACSSQPKQQGHSHEETEAHADGDGHEEHEEHGEAEEGHEHETEAEHAAHSAHGKGIKDIKFDGDHFPTGTFETEKVQKRDFSQIIRVGGQLLPVSGASQTLVAPVSGVLKFAEKKLYPGVSLTRGQILAFVSSTGMGEGDAQSKARANFAKAKSEYDRMSALLKERLVSQREYEQAQLEYENARIAYQVWDKDAKGLSVVSPGNYYVQSVLVQSGDYVQAGQVIARLSRKDKVALQANVPQKYADRVRQVRSANFSVAGQSQVFSMEQKHGRLASVGQSFAENGMIPVTFELDGRDLMPGSMAEVFLKLSAGTKVIAVPLSALTEEQGMYYVYVQESEQQYAKCPVTIGSSDGVRVQILSGLEEGDVLLIKGVYYVKMAGMSGAIPHGHSHAH